MTEVGQQRSSVRKQRERVNRLDAKCFLSALCASAVNQIFDLRLLISALCALLFAFCLPVEAQQPKKVPRIGYLSNTNPSTESARSEAVGQRLRELGYVEGQNVSIDYRYGEGTAIAHLSLRPN
jgi:hypothetical protein